MNRYLIIVVITALLAVALMNGSSQEKANWGEAETKLLMPHTIPHRNFRDIDDTDVTIFKCRKEVTTDNAASDIQPQIDPQKANE